MTPEILDQLLYYASRAPSPHNAQGWAFEVAGSRIRLRLDAAHQVLHELDPRSCEGELACGAAVCNLVMAAAALGFSTEIRWNPQPDVVADIELAPMPPDAAAAGNLAVLQRRAVNRSLYRSNPLPPGVLDELRAMARARGFTLAVVTAPEVIATIGDLAAGATRMKLAHMPTQSELHRLMRFSPCVAADRRDGLDLELFFTRRIAATAASIVMRPSIMRRLHMERRLARSSEVEPIRSAPAVCLLLADAPARDAFARGGACFQEIALAAAKHGIAHAFHSAPIELSLAGPRTYDASVPSDWHAAIDRIRAGLAAAFDCPAGAQPLVLFRLGYPTRSNERRSLRRPRIAPPVEAHHRELTRRNQPAIPLIDQASLRQTRVLFAGCGSIGGAPVEVLARLGLEQMVLAEPGDYETNNLNRQTALLRDVGRNKAAVLRERVLDVNPHAQLLVEPTGVTADNVHWLVGTTDVVVDGVDVMDEDGIAAKRILHMEAWRQRRLVITGLDLAGTQLIRVFDYRNGRTRPFAGRLDGATSRLNATQLLSRLVGALDVPRELLGYTEAVIRGAGGPAPQLAPTANLFGVLAAWAVLDFAAGRPLRRRIRVDIPGLLMPWHRRVTGSFARLATLARLKLLLEIRHARGEI